MTIVPDSLFRVLRALLLSAQGPSWWRHGHIPKPPKLTRLEL